MHGWMGLPALEFASLSGCERLSQVFQYHITLVTPDNPMLTDLVTANVDYKPLVSNSFTVSMALDGGGGRHITGLVTRARFVQSQDRRGVYEVVIEPWLTLAGRTSDFKIFQNKSALDIVREVLGNFGFPLDVRTSEAYPSLAFCERLMIEWGMHQLLDYFPPKHKVDVEYVEYVDHFEIQHVVQPGQWATQEFDFRAPKTDCKQTIPMLRGVVCGHTFTLKGHPHQKCNGNYLVISNSLELQETGNASGDTQYFCHSHFTVQL